MTKNYVEEIVLIKSLRMLKFKKSIRSVGSVCYMSFKFQTDRKITKSRYLLTEVANTMPNDLFRMNLEDLISTANLTNHSIWSGT